MMARRLSWAIGQCLKRRAFASVAAAVLLCAPAVTHAADAALGEYLSAECVTCHQITGQVNGGIPAIVGWPEQAFIEALSAYKTGARDNAVMRTIAARLSDDEIAALAAYFATHKQK